MSLHKSHVHGNSAYLEHPGSNVADGKASVRRAFSGSTGDLINLGGSGGAACLRMGWGARFVIVDTGRKNFAKSGSFWCHYAIPTPVVEDGRRARTRGLEINYESTDIQQIAVAAVHVWDGNRRIFADNNPIRSADDFNGGIAAHTRNSRARRDENRMWKGTISDQFIFFGLSVSLLIRAQSAKDNFLEIRSVGVDFEIRD